MGNEEEAEEYTPFDVDSFITHYYEDVQDIAKKLYKEHGSVESDDIAQAIFEDVVRVYDTGFADLSRGAAMFRLWRSGKAFVKREAIDFMHFSGTFTYTPKLVRSLLEDGHYETQGDTHAGSENQASNVDIMRALDLVGRRKRGVILNRYRDGVKPSEMARGDKDALYEGIDDMTTILNRGVLQTVVGLETV